MLWEPLSVTGRRMAVAYYDSNGKQHVNQDKRQGDVDVGPARTDPIG